MLNLCSNEKQMTTQDKLWKAIIEEFFDDFMHFFFPDFVDQIDTTRPYVEMDKELGKIFPETEELNRHGDKLMKVPMKGGKDQFVLVHIEVQGYKDNDYGRRMYVCQYRIDERYNLPVAALVIYSDKNRKNRFSHYERTTLNTKLVYTFPIFVIADKTQEEYEAMDNPFAIVCQVVLLSFKTKMKDEELLKIKVQLFRKLLEKKYSKKKIQRLTVFIKEKGFPIKKM